MSLPRRRALQTAGIVLLGLVMFGIALWGVLALFYFDHLGRSVRLVCAVGFAVISLGALTALGFPRWRWRAAGAYLAVFALLLVCWSRIAPSNDRPWRPEQALLAYATIQGDRITVHNIRNFDYRTETDFIPAYYDRSFELQQLTSVDLIAVYWMGPAIAHGMLSFGFADGNHLVISVETRSTRGEAYSAVRGFFRQYELYYVVADERDVIRVRTNYRHDPSEQVYLYRLVAPLEDGRRTFLNYMNKLNSLREHPEFYNSLTANCATDIWLNAHGNPDRVPFSWKILLSGYAPQYLYESGKLDTRVSFEELRRRAHINVLAQAADQAEDFSQRIRTTQLPASGTANP
jgi:hypothetical protein